MPQVTKFYFLPSPVYIRAKRKQISTPPIRTTNKEAKLQIYTTATSSHAYTASRCPLSPRAPNCYTSALQSSLLPLYTSHTSPSQSAFQSLCSPGTFIYPPPNRLHCPPIIKAVPFLVPIAAHCGATVLHLKKKSDTSETLRTSTSNTAGQACSNLQNGR